MLQSRLKYRYIVWIVLGLLVINTVHVFNLYIVRFGNLDFFNLSDHFFVLGNLVIALGSVIAAWYFTSNRIHMPLIRLLSSFFLALLLFTAVSSIYYVLIRFSHGASTSLAFLGGHIVFSFSSAFIHVAGLTFAVLFFHEKNRITIENLKIKQEKQTLEHQLLVRNLEPHFLLNCLSNFSHIIKKDQAEAEKFLESFSSIYRYFIKHNQTDLVSLKEELTFMTHYLYLLEKRYGKAYSIENHIRIEKAWIIPFAIQMCVENAIKHNEGFAGDPLKISIRNDAKHVIVENDWRPVNRDESTGYGMKNLKSRSKLITGEEVIAEQNNSKFIVKIPVITAVE